MSKVNRSEQDKKEIRKMIFTGVFAAIAIAAIVFVVLFYFKTVKANKTPGVIKEDVASIKNITLSANEITVPYVQTDIASIVYSADSAGNIMFFEFNGKDYSKIEETGTINVNVPLSSQQIPVSIHYIERDGVLTGYGVYTPNTDNSIYIYNFMLCKITNLPASYNADGKCLLLANTDMKSVYSETPVWEEAYVLDRTTSATTRFLSENNRTVGISGAVRADFCMLTDTQAKVASGQIPFFSSRAYDSSSSAPVDLYVKSGSKELQIAANIGDKYSKVTDDGGIVFIRTTSNGFTTKKYLDGQETTVTEFYSKYGEEYIRSGDWLLCKEDGRLYTTYDSTIIELPDFKINPVSFAVSPDGKYVVLAGTVTNATDYQIYVYNTQTKKSKIFADGDYSVHYNLFFPSNTTACYYTKTTTGYNTVIIDLSKI